MIRRLLIEKDPMEGSFFVEADLSKPCAYIVQVKLSGEQEVIKFDDLSGLPLSVADSFREWMDAVFTQ